MLAINRIAIIGSGAIGSYYGARLVQAGMDVTFLLRNDYDYVSENGLKVSSVAGDIELPAVQCTTASADIGPVDLVIVAWKATSNSYYDKVISPLLHRQTLILTLQNGLGNVEELARLFGSRRIFGGLCFVCINRTGPGELCHSASGMIRVGEYESEAEGVSARLAELVQLLRRGGINARAESELGKAQWMKLVWNIPFNGLTIAEGGVDTEILLLMPGMEDRILGIMREVQAVSAALGYVIEDDFLEKQIEVTRPMKAYRPSSMIDYVEGREVEVEAIWREAVLRAWTLGIKVPKIERLLGEIELRLKQRAN